MAVSLNSVLGFNSTLPDNYQHVCRSSITALSPTVTSFSFSSGTIGSRANLKERRSGSCSSVADSDRLAFDTTGDKGPGAAENSNGASVSKPNTESAPKRSPLTARERLKAARVLSRYGVSKPSKSEMGNKVLDALKESDKKDKKRPGLPEAPTNMFDDSDRGLPKDGWTFQFPGGTDLFVIAFSFVFISTVMFATTYIVWKVGAIHFNEF